MTTRQLDLVGQKFGRLLVLEKLPNDGSGTKFLCQCDCGNKAVFFGSRIKSGSNRSCGCLAIEKGKVKLPYGHAARNELIGAYKSSAKKRNINFELTDDELIWLFDQPCFYCGRKHVSTKSRKNMNGDFHYNGIDRIDNNGPYSKTNTITACVYCNIMKSNMTLKDFLNHIMSIYNHLLLGA